ncbi:MAG TPA: hypothetical protein VFZ65_16060 [Planctomycetota bacterium]|nr:hypothetical protein [Planctomycetota bacterium]
MHRALLFSLLLPAAPTAAQGPAEAGPDPVVLVAEGERLFRNGDDENAALVLWQALDLLAQQPGHPLHDATVRSAHDLLAQHDAREKDRRRVFTSIARQQVELARSYRLKKWFEVAGTRLDIAARYDGEEVKKERALLEAARPKPKVEPPAAPEKVRPCAALQHENTVFSAGKWTETGDLLESEPHPGGEGELREWIAIESHADHQISVEFRPVEASKPFNCALGFGLEVLEGTTFFSGHRFFCQFLPEGQQYCLMLWSIRGDKIERLATANLLARGTADGFHRLVAQVRGRSISVQLDDLAPLAATASAPVAGRIGLFVGVTTAPSGAVQFRNLHKEALPADEPSDEEVRRRAAAERQAAVVATVERAKELLAKKEPEPASLLLRQALEQVRGMAEGVLRDNLAASIEAQLEQADPLAKKRKKTAQAIAAELVALADQYAAAGAARQALAIVEHALAFDPTRGERLAAAREAVRAWNAAQAAARANELQPPADDGAVLREWFAGGAPIDPRFPPWVVAGPAARAENLPPQSATVLLPKAGTPPLGKASVFVHLARADMQAGLCFDVAGAHDYATAFLDRGANGLALCVYRCATNRWLPIARAPVPIDQWRLDGWLQVELEATAKGITARAGGVELAVERQRLGLASGRFGLFAGNGTTAAATVELRGFQVPK